MPPIPFTQAARCCATAIKATARQPSLVSLFAALSVQTRSASILANLSDNKGAYHKRIRRGRGPSSGYGKTAGRGHKGTGQHSSIKPWFQGGQTPLIVSHGRHGFVNHRAPEMMEFNIDQLQTWIDNGRLDPTKPITPRELIKSGIVGSTIKDGIKMLARGGDKLKTPVDIIVSRASAAAIKAVEAAGGKIVTRFYTKESLKRLVKGQSVNTDKPLPVGPEHVESVLEQVRTSKKHYYRLPDPTSRDDIEYYRDPAHRGYLSHTLKPGESPSLFFKVPGTEAPKARPMSKEKAEELASRLF